MPLYYGVDPSEITPPEVPPELDVEKLEAIHKECDHLAEVITAFLIEMNNNKQTQTVRGSDIYHSLGTVNKVIKRANGCIDLICENARSK